MSAVIRRLRTEDIDAVMPIERSSFPAPWTKTMFHSEVANPDRIWLGVEADGTLLGYGGAMVVHGEAHVMNLAVADEARRAGIGTALLSALIERAVDAGANHITLEVRETNEAAIALYESAGLHDVGTRPGYYAETGESARIMWSDELDHPGALARREQLRVRGEAALSGWRAGASASAIRPAAAGVRAGASAGMPPAGAELVLAIETSCDETAAAVMRGGTETVASVVASQVDFHSRFGGVVPEIASRKHTEAIVAVVDEALEQAGRALGFDGPLPFGGLDAIAVTYGPGLVGALVVGLAYAKGLSFATGVPLVGVNHLEGHLFANLLADPTVAPPLVALLVSGGHTSLVYVPQWGEYRVLGETLDDAAGEAFDKVAKVLGLGYPGGPVISRLAEEGDPQAIDFPRAMLNSGDYSFSLSGLKTAVINHIRHAQRDGVEIHLPDLAASFQQAVIDVQVAKAVRAVEEYGVRRFCLGGGVAANRALRDALTAALTERGIAVSVPPFALCTDNAAMIGAAGTFRFRRGERLPLAAEALADLRLDDR